MTCLSCSSSTLSLLLLFTFSCKTDKTAPTIASTYPVNGATGVALNARLMVVFSEPMEHSSAEGAFAVVPATGGSFAWDGAVMRFISDSPLLPNTAYAMTMSTGALDLAGNALAAGDSVGFSTGDTSYTGLVDIWMMGRSVMSGWFSHWGADPVYARDRFTLKHKVLEGPPDIVASVQALVDSVSMCETPVVFFKLCFVDFEGSDSVTAQANLDRNLGYVAQVESIVAHRGLKLIVGNALPQVASATDPWLVWNHRQYNQRLIVFAAAHPDVRVFDFYSVLSTADGALRPEYAISGSDSHPNDAGYLALDTPFFAFLNQYY
jgi:hypothetical protein